MMHATLSVYSALRLVVGDSKGGILEEKVQHMYKKKQYNVYANEQNDKTKETRKQDRHTIH